VGGLVLVVLLFAGKYWLRTQRNKTHDREQNIERLLERIRESDLQIPLPGPPPGEAERKLVVDLAAVEATLGFKGRADGVTFESYRYGDGHHQLTYDYTDDTDEDAPTWACTLVHSPSETIARATFKEILKEYRDLGFDEEGTELRHGDESADLRFHDDYGRAFVCRDGRHLFAFTCFDLGLAQGDLSRLLAPYLERFTTWKP